MNKKNTFIFSSEREYFRDEGLKDTHLFFYRQITTRKKVNWPKVSQSFKNFLAVDDIDAPLYLLHTLPSQVVSSGIFRLAMYSSNGVYV